MVNMWYVFQVMVEYIWWCCSQNIQSMIYMIVEIWYQSFNFDLWVFFLNGSNVICKVLGIVIVQVIMVNGGDNYIMQCYIGNGLCQFYWFIGIRSYWVIVGNIIEWIMVGINSVEDYKCCCVVVEVFCQVRVGGFFVDRMQVIFVYCGFDVLDMCRVCWKFDFYLFWFVQQGFVFCCYVFNWDKGYFIGIVVFNIVFYYNGFIYSVCVLVVNYEGKCFNLIDCCNY